MRRILAVILLISIAGSATSMEGGSGNDQDQSETIYRDVYSRSVVAFNQKEREVFVGDVGNAYTICQADNELICIDARNFSFAIKRDRGRLKIGDQWAFKGPRYQLGGIRKMSVLGRSEVAYEVEMPYKEFTAVFFYSYEDGLLAFGRRGTRSTVFFLEGLKGVAQP